MAKRLILTMLALLTGLFAQIGPAQANPCAAGESAFGMVVEGEAAARPKAVCVSHIGQPRFWVAQVRHIHAPCYVAAPYPAVRIGIDRARE